MTERRQVTTIPPAVDAAIIAYRDADDYIPAHNALLHLRRAILDALNEAWRDGWEDGLGEDDGMHGAEPEDA